jgi:Brp/Blh family beta-carotene 15,15'-monooxygenase
MAVFGVFWYFFPIASLLIFIAISAFHFGETDLAIDQPRLDPVIILFQTSYGLMLILALLLTHKEDTIAVLSFLEKGSEIQFAKLIHNPALSLTATLGTASVLFLSTLWYCFKYRPTLSWYKTIALQTVLLAFILIFLPFPLAFAFYFGCWHSIQSLVNIRTFLGIALKRKLTWSWVIIKVMPFSLVAFFGIAVLALWVSYTSDIHTYTMLMFIGISILTAPHLEVMSEMYAQLRK